MHPCLQPVVAVPDGVVGAAGQTLRNLVPVRREGRGGDESDGATPREGTARLAATDAEEAEAEAEAEAVAVAVAVAVQVAVAWRTTCGRALARR